MPFTAAGRGGGGDGVGAAGAADQARRGLRGRVARRHTDRGTLEVGKKADLNVIDFAKLALQRPEMKFDLPAGGRRLLQQATGYTATIKSGQVTYRGGIATGALPGTLVRGAQG